jgi:hypothetical protein
LSGLADQLGRGDAGPGAGGGTGDGEALGAQLAVLADGAYQRRPSGPGRARRRRARPRPPAGPAGQDPAMSDNYEHVLIEDQAQWRAWLDAS